LCGIGEVAETEEKGKEMIWASSDNITNVQYQAVRNETVRDKKEKIMK
jgi:hypothetical protein